MTSPTNTSSAADPIRAYLDLGLRNYWYPVAPSWQVANAPIGLTRLGEQLVVWRDQEGRVHALEDRCPHRGARLSLGWNLGDRVACWYHGVDPKYRRAQTRYVGTGGTGVAKDVNTVPAGNFTFSTMVIPACNIGPSHIHIDVEEIFFVIRGKMKVICEKDGEKWETLVGERDLISVPPGVYRTEINIGDEDALMCVMLGSPKPITPTYPPDSPLAKIKR